METKLSRISQLSSENPEMVFTSVGHLINKELLKECHEKMDGDKAVGIDGITKDEYGRNLDENLEGLVERLKEKSYKPQPAWRVEIPKENGKIRALSIYSYEDKLVQEALKRILEAVFEPNKGSLIEFGRYAEEQCKRKGRKPGTFTFLGSHTTVPMAGAIKSG